MYTIFATDASPVWRGIEFGLELLKEGIISRIGDGRNIRIHRDNWIPRKSGLNVANFTRPSRLRWVNQLLNQDSNEWNEELVHRIFPAYEVEEICRIKLPSHKTEDCTGWHPERSGIFTVKSAYRLAMQLKERENPQASTSSSDADNRSIWDLI